MSNIREALRAARQWIVNGNAPIGWCVDRIDEALAEASRPIDMILFCPKCGVQHIDGPTSEWDNPPHRSHLCHGCGHIWRPSDVATNGVAAIKTAGKADSPNTTPEQKS